MTTITKEKKKEIVEELCQNIAKQDGVFFLNFKGIKGGDSREIRKSLKEAGAKMIVARKTLVKIAFEKEGIAFDPLTLEGEASFVFSFEDGVTTAKVLDKFRKDGRVSVLGGVYEGKILTSQEVEMLAKLPTREELLSKLVGTIAAPVSGFLQVLQGNTKGLLYVLSSINQKK